MKLVVDTNFFIKAFGEGKAGFVAILYNIWKNCCEVVFPEDCYPVPRELKRHLNDSKEFWIWWGQMNTERKIHWLPYKRLTRPQRGLSKYDLALVAVAKKYSLPLVLAGDQQLKEYAESFGVQVCWMLEDYARKEFPCQ